MKKGMLIILTFLLFSTCVYSVKDLMALQGSVKDLGGNPVYGNITVTVHNDPLGGTQIYNSGTDFYGNINNGQYDLMLGSGSNELELEFGKHYYIDLIINGEDIDFDGNERFRFQSSTGTIKNINLSGDNLSIMNGNVGIGTTNPDASLVVDSSMTIHPGFGDTVTAMFGRRPDGGASRISLDYSSGVYNFWEVGSSDGYIYNQNGEVIRFAANRNVGIGTTAPISKLDVSGSLASPLSISSTTPALYFHDTEQGGAQGPGDDNRYDSWMIRADASNLYFGERNNSVSDTPSIDNTRVTFTDDGNVGIGTASPSQKLDINGDLRIRGKLSCSGKLYTDASGNVLCGTDLQGITSESDPQVASVTSGRWCRGTGSQVTCDQSAPGGLCTLTNCATRGTSCGSNEVMTSVVSETCSCDDSYCRCKVNSVRCCRISC